MTATPNRAAGQLPLKPDAIDRHGPKYRAGAVKEFLVAELAQEGDSIVKRQTKTMNSHIESATETVESATKIFGRAIDALNLQTTQVGDASKKASTNVRKAANDLQEGLQRIEKLANFDRLERQVALLERAAAALSVLAELERSGKLDRIVNAVK